MARVAAFLTVNIVASSASAMPVPGSASRWTPSAATREEKASVDAATKKWIDIVTSPGDSSQSVLNLYADDAVFLGSVSEDVRVGPLDIKNYFDYFADIPGLRVKPGSFKSVVQIFGDFAISSGYYEFQYPKDNGKLNTVPARFTFAYRRRGDTWEIVNHHSSKTPEQPEVLKPVAASVPNALRIVVAILKNIVEHPYEAKFRAINLAGIAGKELTSSPDAMSLLHNCGFVEEGTTLVFPASAPIPALSTALQTLQTAVSA